MSMSAGVLDGRCAIVTGAARGIGLAVAQLLSEHGAHLVISDIDGEAAEEAAGELSGEAAVHTGDLAISGAPERLVATAVGSWGQVDIVVNNAGYTLDAAVHKTPDDWYDRMLEIHAVVPFRVIRAAAPYLREPAKAEQRQGVERFRKIVNVSSISGLMGNAGQAGYAAGKAGVIGLTKTLAKEWGRFRVNCNAVAFGWIETRLTAPRDDRNQVRIGGKNVQLGIPEDVRRSAVESIPLGRPGTPDEAAGAVFFLCSPWSDYVHGQVLNVTGGQTLGMGS